MKEKPSVKIGYKIRINNEKESIKIQRKLFKYGFSWGGKYGGLFGSSLGGNYIEKNVKFLFIDNGSGFDMAITHDGLNVFNEDSDEEITFEKFMSKEFQEEFKSKLMLEKL